MLSLDTYSMQVFDSVTGIRDAVLAARAEGATVGFVPTMGALHEGHLSLVDAARAECDLTVVSIFVNPTQFGPEEDHDRYPRDLKRDCRLLESRGCSFVFAPETSRIYRPWHETFVEVGSVARPWEGLARPGHFRGVATVVLKLFNIVPADRAYFGRKDYQQSLVVQQMVTDFDLPIEIRVCPVVRESDGLAMSSRNSYLDPIERVQATTLWQTLQLAESLVHSGIREVQELSPRLWQNLREGGITNVDYLAFLADGTVKSVTEITGPTVVALAAVVGKTRLIDNHTIH